MSIKINKLEIENVKRVKAVKIEPSSNGLTIIGGNNNQGKTSILDAIAWALGGNKFKPSEPMREGSMIPPALKIELSNGLIVERKGKNSDLKVTDPSGNKSGQGLLDSFVEELALDLPKFINSSNKDKANTLLQIIGVGDLLYTLDTQEKTLYNQRFAIGQIADQKKKFADEQPYYSEAPKELISASDLIKKQQDILAINGENQRKRQKLAEYEQRYATLTAEVERITKHLVEAQRQLAEVQKDLAIAKTETSVLVDQSTEELEKNINQVEEINRMVRANFDKEKAAEEAENYANQYKQLTEEIEKVRKDKFNLLNNANLPLPGLSIEDGELTFNGQKWDNMSASEQLRVATAIVRKLKPDCGFVLLDKLEQMDIPTLTAFGEWLESEGLQAIATRVSTGGECQIIIEDGYVQESPENIMNKGALSWK